MHHFTNDSSFRTFIIRNRALLDYHWGLVYEKVGEAFWLLRSFYQPRNALCWPACFFLYISLLWFILLENLLWFYLSKLVGVDTKEGGKGVYGSHMYRYVVNAVSCLPPVKRRNLSKITYWIKVLSSCLWKNVELPDTFVNLLYCMFYSACLSMLTIIVCDFNWNYVARDARI